jgi:hypothetical protein
VKVAFGAKRTNRDVSLRPCGSKMTHKRHLGRSKSIGTARSLGVIQFPDSRGAM